MERITIAGLLLVCSSLLFAATPIPSPVGIALMTKTQVLNSTPTVAGVPIICTNCTNVQNGTGYVLCVATETITARNGYIVEGSSPTAVTACQ